MLRRFRIPTSELSLAVSFCKDALNLRVLHGGVEEGQATLSEGNSCELTLVGTPRPVPTSQPLSFATLPYPFLTYGVSNLKTSIRHAKRHGGEALFSGPAPGEAAMYLPGGSGFGFQSLHLFRRNPCVNVTLGVCDPTSAASVLVRALGMRVLDGKAGEEAHARVGRGALVLAGSENAPHNTTSLVLEPLGRGAAGTPSHSIIPEATLTVEVADPGAAIRVFDAAGIPTSSPSRDSQSFVALFHEYLIHVVRGGPLH